MIFKCKAFSDNGGSMKVEASLLAVQFFHRLPHLDGINLDVSISRFMPFFM